MENNISGAEMAIRFFSLIFFFFFIHSQQAGIETCNVLATLTDAGHA